MTRIQNFEIIQFKPVPSKVDFPSMESDILNWWEQVEIVGKYLKRNNFSDKRYSFIDGPITANNPMGVHHAWGRTYKDLYQRYKTMQGFKQRYQNGFDGQGLWIEVEVEKELGFSSKRDIESFGVDKFVERCKERVRKFAAIQTEQSVRLGYWMDWENSYHTMSDENNYTIWHFLKVCNERGWLYQGTDVMPWCPRCGTGLSEHEIVTEGYKEITHEAAFVKFPLENRDNESLLVWTTTPWTLPSNVAAAVHPELSYVKVRQDNEVFYLAKALIQLLRGEYQILEEFPGKNMVGLTYKGPFDELPVQKEVKHQVLPWLEVTESEGTGIVHIAPGAGKDDFALGKLHNIPTIAPLDEAGIFIDGFDWLTGLKVGEVNQRIFEDLSNKGLLYHVEQYSHRYPVCWRCDTELVFRLVDEWFISMKELRHLIADVTRKIRWIPEFGMDRELDWLRNMDDWMISKKRYWGLALPIYSCNCGHFEVIGSKDELKERAVEGWQYFEGHSPHKPWIDAIKILCTSCGNLISRIRDVGNPWLDAGIVPFSTLSYLDDNNYWSDWFPADWISESFPGQFRNWFYSLLAQSTVLENREPFRTVFSYALMRDEKGEEMHKSKGNAIWFEDAAEKMGVDAIRWVYVRHNPAANLNFGYNATEEARRRFFIPLWNVYSFFVTYANIDQLKLTDLSASVKKSVLDKWISSELNSLIQDVSYALENYDSVEAGRRMEEFVELLSNWYVRRSRRRFWKSESDEDKLAAYTTLYTCLNTFIRLLAPFTPFITEEIYQNLVRSVDQDAPESIHLTDFPVADAQLIDTELSKAMRLTMNVARLGRAARQKAAVRVRQPLAKMNIKVKDKSDFIVMNEPRSSDEISREIRDELNIQQIEGKIIFSDDEMSEWYDYEVMAKLDTLGPKYGSNVAAIVKGLARLDPKTVVQEINQGNNIHVGAYELLPEEIGVKATDKVGWVSASAGGYVVRVAVDLTPDLIQEGLKREIVHVIQNMRRSAGFEITDHIVTWYSGDQNIVGAIRNNSDYICQETLSNELREAAPNPPIYIEDVKLNGERLSLGVERI
jgi:isoleucyl-tRNA synthetase